MRATCRPDSPVPTRWPTPLHCRALLGDRRGAAAVEYGLIAALVAVTVLIGVFALGGSVNDLWAAVGKSMLSAFGGE
ncbi:MAG: Flp family type IVb pilin [Geminicoccaceae bacterium]